MGVTCRGDVIFWGRSFRSMAFFLGTLAVITPVFLPTAHGFTQGRSSNPNTANLLLSEYIDTGRAAAGRQASKAGSVPGLSINSYAGFLTANKQLGNHLFFWLFESSKPSAPLLVWLNGGPGVSSMQGVLWEHGPVEARTGENGNVRLYPRDVYWAQEFSVVYIDSPVGVGYSYTDNSPAGNRSTASGAADDLYNFLGQFYQIYTEYANRPLYIGGQSYAGKYSMVLGHKIHTEKQAGRSNYPLAGIYVGGPFVDPTGSLLGTLQMLFNFGAISKSQLDTHVGKVNSWTRKFQAGELANGSAMAILGDVLNLEVVYRHGTDNYLKGEPVGDAAIQGVMRDPPIQSALHIKAGQPFNNYNDALYDKFGADFLRKTTDQMAVLMSHYKVLVYSGDMDLTVPSDATENAILAANWSGAQGYRSSTRTLWWGRSTTGAHQSTGLIGYYTHVEKFCRVVVKNAGHQTPRDQPVVSMKMISDFVNHGCIVPDVQP